MPNGYLSLLRKAMSQGNEKVRTMISTTSARWTLAAAMLALAGAAHAAGPAAWTVDRAHSKLGFTGSYSGTKFDGAFGDWSANIVFDPKALAQSKAVVSINLASAKTGDDDRDQSLPGDDWFSTGKFPKASFTTTAIKSLGGDQYQASGVISLKGVSRPATLNFSLKINGAKAQMTGQASIDRTQWGVGGGQFTGETPVAHAVTVNVSISATKAGS
jgi:polyisoprenoid-binding protein YceI